MDILHHLEVYINAQKTVGLQSIVFGTSFLVTAILFHVFGDSSVSNGLRTGSLIFGLILIGLGVGLRINQGGLLQKQTELYQNDKLEFQEVEHERMLKVRNANSRDQRIIVVLIVISLAIFHFVKIPFWQGVSFCFIVFLLGVMIIDVFSFHSVKAYYEQLKP